MKILPEVINFEWDKGNIDKNFKKHNVTNKEAEEVFKNRPIFISKDIKHSQKELRFYVLGKTDEERKLFISFTIRKKRKIRIISARDMSQKERSEYEKKIKTNPSI